MTFVRKIKVGKRVYYAEVKNERVDGKVVQRHIRYLGKDPKAPRRRFDIEPVHLGFLTIGMMERVLTPEDVFEMLISKGEVVTKRDLEKVGIEYVFLKKTMYVCLYEKKKSLLKKDVKFVKKKRLFTKRTRGR
jgi:hypothetical protein